MADNGTDAASVLSVLGALTSHFPSSFPSLPSLPTPSLTSPLTSPGLPTSPLTLLSSLLYLAHHPPYPPDPPDSPHLTPHTPPTPPDPTPLLMAFTALHNQNPFILPTLLLGLLLLTRALSLHRPGRLRVLFLKAGPALHHALILAFLTSLSLIVIFESYFTVYECAVSTRYYTEVLDVARQTMAALTASATPFWLDYATLLAALRYQAINPWDHDADLSILHPDYSRTHPRPYAQVTVPPRTSSPLDLIPPPSVAALIDQLASRGLHPTWDASRHLIQTRLDPTAGPHIDLWLWAPAIDPDDGVMRLWTADLTVRYNAREWAEVWPLRNVTWLGMQAQIPHDSHRISSKEFGVYGGSYLIASVFRGDCWHNFFNFRWSY